MNGYDVIVQRVRELEVLFNRIELTSRELHAALQNVSTYSWYMMRASNPTSLETYAEAFEEDFRSVPLSPYVPDDPASTLLDVRK